MLGTLVVVVMMAGAPGEAEPGGVAEARGPGAGVAAQAGLVAQSDKVKATLTEAFGAALAGDFKRYLAVVHPSEKATPEQVGKLERFTFSRFARQVVWYLKGDKADSFVVERVEELGGGKVKVFVKVLAHPSRPAMPMTLQDEGGAALVLSNSL
ncbi:MAG TPA: hypothetical protein PK095_13810 [Myxococcota bacterium]|nr:hypothetical protein [Myxococcota bacterium]